MDTNPNDLTTPDLLALLPHVFGSEPRNVLAIQTLIDRGLGAAFTLELPKREIDLAVRRIATSAVGAVSSVPGADSVLFAVYSDRRTGERMRPFEKLQSFVASRCTAPVSTSPIPSTSRRMAGAPIAATTLDAVLRALCPSPSCDAGHANSVRYSTTEFSRPRAAT